MTPHGLIALRKAATITHSLCDIRLRLSYLPLK